MERDIQGHLSKSFGHSSHSPRREKDFASLQSPMMFLHSIGFSRWFHLSFSHLVRSLSPAPSLLFSPLAPLLPSCLLPAGLKTNHRYTRKISPLRWWWAAQPSDCLAAEGRNAVGERFPHSSYQKSKRQNSRASSEKLSPLSSFRRCQQLGKASSQLRTWQRWKSPFGQESNV